MKFFKRLVLLMSVAALFGTVFFVSFVVETFSFRQREGKTDAIVVLTGGRGRVEEGERLYRERQGNVLFLIGVDPSVRKRELFRTDSPGEGIILEKTSRNTFENAIYARPLILERKIGSILLLTSRYHMMRAILIFRSTFPKDIVIYPHPVDSRNLREDWWTDFGSVRLLFSEFYKYSLYRIFFLFGGGEFKGSHSLH